MEISKYFLGTFVIVSSIGAVIGLLHRSRYIIFPLHMLSAILLLTVVLATIFMILLYLINGSIKSIITDHVNNLGANIKSHEENCQDNVIKLTKHITELSTNIQVQNKDITKQEENTTWLSKNFAIITKHITELSTNIQVQNKDITKQEENTTLLSNKFAIIENLAMDRLIEDSLDDTQKANPDLVEIGSYILTHEGEETLPKDLKKMIESMVLEVKIESSEDALDLLAKIGRDELKEFAKQSNLQFKEIVALSILYATKMSEGSK